MAGRQNQAVGGTLLTAAKNYLDITWDDPATDVKLTGILRRGIAFLDHVAGAELDYNEEGIARALLFDYARYARENATDSFSTAYVSELMALHHLHVPVQEAADE